VRLKVLLEVPTEAIGELSVVEADEHQP